MKPALVASPKIALALSGGGPLGAIFEIGALYDLQELLNGISPRELCATLIENDHDTGETFDPSWLLSPAYGKFAQPALMLPGLRPRSKLTVTTTLMGR